jgi:hypothetical protein
MLLDVVRWQVIKLAALRCSPDGTRIRANSFCLLVAMLAAADERVWQDDRRLYTWPCYAQLTKQTTLSKGLIGPARQELIAASLILPLAGRPQARWQRSDCRMPDLHRDHPLA